MYICGARESDRTRRGLRQGLGELPDREDDCRLLLRHYIYIYIYIYLFIYFRRVYVCVYIYIYVHIENVAAKLTRKPT